MKIHDKMAADQLWVRSHSYHDRFTIYQTQGQHFPIYHAPNLAERTEMTYRTIGRNFDWDLEKFRLGRKHSDKGGRRRLLKNASMFLKNPVGYIFWRIQPRIQHMRTSVFIFFVGTLINFNNLFEDTLAKDRRDEYLQSVGETPEKSHRQLNTQRENKLGVVGNPLYYMLYTRPTYDMVVLNPTYRQNFRLYFDRQDFKA